MQATIDILQKLIAFKTVSLQSNLELIDYIESYLNSFAITSKRVYSEDKLQANLFATIGNSEKGGICFSGHSDVVPVENQPWSSDPFSLYKNGDKYYGRGTADMKGYLACVLSLVPEFIAATRSSNATPIHIAISYDEEVGCVGVRRLIDQLAEQENKPIACIIGEPTMMQVATAHKGKSAWRCSVHGVAAHSSQPHLGINAIEYTAELVTFLQKSAREWQTTENDNRYSPPFSTIQVGTIKGGTAVNVVPDYCQFDFEVRPLPTTSTEKLLQPFNSLVNNTLKPAIQSQNPQSDIKLKEQVNYPGLVDDDSLAELKTICSNAVGATSFCSLSFGTEAGLFQQAGIPTVVCGPGSIDVAHKANEYVEHEQLEQCMAFLRKVIASD
ncbi:acetylornithine deacetylase [Vibrio sp. MA40-2]|uniref:acetylornithine deacetylase n=1 Tax=Vibrio sp. MA40-2 TaxID=3391828 RepID=UPI0039A4F9AE